jgi:hypothetical protein
MILILPRAPSPTPSLGPSIPRLLTSSGEHFFLLFLLGVSPQQNACGADSVAQYTQPCSHQIR